MSSTRETNPVDPTYNSEQSTTFEEFESPRILQAVMRWLHKNMILQVNPTLSGVMPLHDHSSLSSLGRQGVPSRGAIRVEIWPLTKSDGSVAESLAILRLKIIKCCRVEDRPVIPDSCPCQSYSRPEGSKPTYQYRWGSATSAAPGDRGSCKQGRGTNSAAWRSPRP